MKFLDWIQKLLPTKLTASEKIEDGMRYQLIAPNDDKLTITMFLTKVEFLLSRSGEDYVQAFNSTVYTSCVRSILRVKGIK